MSTFFKLRLATSTKYVDFYNKNLAYRIVYVFIVLLIMMMIRRRGRRRKRRRRMCDIKPSHTNHI